MHELALCGSIAEIVRRHASGRRVETVRLRVGQLRQVVPDTLEYCWTMVTAQTPLDATVLLIEHVPARLRCKECGAEHDMGDDFRFACDCGSTAVSVVAGEEFTVASLDVVAEVAP
jgi:hydrogenase nickel incorporation protein HypA/HybF